MKRTAALAVFILFAVSVSGFNISLDAEANFVHTSYIKNSTYDILPALQEQDMHTSQAFEKLMLRAEKRIEEVKFVFDARFYLYAGGAGLDYTVDNAYFQIENGPFIAYLGKQRIKWGTGYTWNPTDLLQPGKEILDPEINLEGIYALRAEYSSPLFTPSLVLAADTSREYEHSAESFTAALSLYKFIGTMDIFVNGIYRYNNRQSLGAAIAWDVDWFVINAEYAAARYMRKEPELIYKREILGTDETACSWLIGINRQMGQDLFINLEYYHNGFGLSNSEFDSFVYDGIAPRYLSLSMKRDYLAGTFSLAWYDKFSVSLTSVYGMNDGSIFIYPVIAYVENPNFTVELGYIGNFSDETSPGGYYSLPVRYAAEFVVTAYF